MLKKDHILDAILILDLPSQFSQDNQPPSPSPSPSKRLADMPRARQLAVKVWKMDHARILYSGWLFFWLFISAFFFVKKAKQHTQNNQNDKKPALESEVGDPKPTGVVRCGARMRLDVRT